jgi:hypothetical protein
MDRSLHPTSLPPSSRKADRPIAANLIALVNVTSNRPLAAAAAAAAAALRPIL